MKYRAFEHAGTILDRIDATDGEEFGIPAEVAAAAVAEVLNVPAAQVSVIETAVPPVPTRALPVTEPQESTDTDLDTIDAILNKADEDVTAGEVKALVLQWARRARTRGRI